jgi:hypothetical protein
MNNNIFFIRNSKISSAIEAFIAITTIKLNLYRIFLDHNDDDDDDDDDENYLWRTISNPSIQ